MLNCLIGIIWQSSMILLPISRNKRLSKNGCFLARIWRYLAHFKIYLVR